MLKVKIVKGKAIEEDRLNSENKVNRLWNKYFPEPYQLIDTDKSEIQVVEGGTYWAWSVGNGKVVLLEEIVE